MGKYDKKKNRIEKIQIDNRRKLHEQSVRLDPGNHGYFAAVMIILKWNRLSILIFKKNLGAKSN